ncbi:MAG TPA: ABC transporter substrate-binding protein [Micromonospora sp.]
MILATGACSVVGAESADTEDEVTIAISTLQTLDPAFARGSGSDLSILSQIYSSLTTLQADGSVGPGLATSWEQRDPRTWVFHLVKDAKFVNGAALDADVVAWNFDRMFDPNVKATANTGYELLDKVTTENPTTVVFTTKEPWLELPRRVTWTYLLEPEWAKAHNPKTEAMPSGPYKLVSYNMASDVVLERNDGYYGTKPAIEKVRYKVLPQSSSVIAGLKSGEVDVAYGLDPLDLNQVKGDPRLSVGSIGGATVSVLGFNTLAGKPTADQRVRAAVNYAVDTAAIARSVLNGTVSPHSTQLLSKPYDGFDDSLKPWPHDPDKARQLLKEAGYSGGLALTIGFTSERGDIAVTPTVQALAEQLKQVGIDLKLQTVSGSKWVDFLRDKQHAPDMAYLGFASQSLSTIELLSQRIETAPYTWGPVDDAYDDAVARAKTAATPEARQQAIGEALRAAADDAALVWLWTQPRTYAVDKRLTAQDRHDSWVRATELTWSGNGK